MLLNLSPFWRRLLLIAAILFALLLLCAGVMYWRLKQVPEFYRLAMEVSPPQLAEGRQQLIHNVEQLKKDMRFQPRWTIQLSERQVNGWLADRYGKANNGISNPRVRIRPGRVELGCQARHGPLAVIIWAALRIRLTDMSNVIEVEVESVQAGSMSIAWTGLLDRADRALDQTQLQVRWFREERPMRLEVTVPMRWQGLRRSLSIEEIDFADGEVRLSGSAGP